MKKTIFLIFFCMALLFAGITVSAAEVQITVNQPESTVDIYLNDFPGEYTYSVFNNTDIADTILSDISESAYICLTFENMPSGEYRIVFNFNNGEILEHTFTYLSPDDAQAILYQLKYSASYEELLGIMRVHPVIIESCELFEEFITDSDTLQSETARILFNDRNWNSLDEFYVSFNKSVILAHLNNAGHPEEILEIIMKNQAVIENCELLDEFTTGSDKLKYETAIILLKNRNWNSLDEFYVSFNESVLLAKINTADLPIEIYELLNEYKDILDVPYEYDKLRDDQKILVIKHFLHAHYFYSLKDFVCRLDDAIKSTITSKPNSGGGGSSGGSRRSSGKFNIYICDINGEALTATPADGTPVKISIRAAYNSEPSLTYAVAVYDNNDALKQIELFKSHATQQYEPEFYEIVTDYISDGKIKVLSLENTATFKPLDIEGIAFFNKYDKTVPQAEQEIDGIKAVKGYVLTQRNVTPDYFTLEVDEHRAFGYWTYLPLNEDNRIKIYTPHIINDLYDNDTAYYLRLSGDKYIFEGTSLNDELIDFTQNDIISCDEQSITILNGSEKVTYPLSSECKFYIDSYDRYEINDFINEGEFFTAQIIDGQITVINAVTYTYEKVISVSNDRILTDVHTYEYSDLVEFHPTINDIVMIYNDRCVKAVNGQKGFISEDGVLIAGKVYPVCCEVKDSFNEGEPCIAYLDPHNQFVKYLDKDWDSYQTAIVTKIYENSLATTDGVLPLPDYVCLNGMIMPTKSALEDLPDTQYFAIRYCEFDNTDVNLKIDILTAANINGQYSEYTNSIGEYIFDKNTQLFAYTKDELIQIPKLKHSYTYSGIIFSDHNNNPVYAVINDDTGETLTETNIMLVTNIENGAVHGYVDDTSTSLYNFDFNFEILIGDLLKITYFNNELKSIEPYFSPTNYGDSEYISSDVVYAPVSKLKDNVIVLAGNAYFINPGIPIYVCNAPYNALSVGELNDIFCNPLNLDESNRVMIQKESDGFVKNLVILK